MKVLHVASSISKLGGGPSRSVQGLVAAQERAGVDAWLMPLKERGLPWVDGIKHFRCPGLEGAWGVRAATEKAIDEICPDIVHVHSIWQPSLHQAIVAARKKKVPYVIAPRGTVERWSLRQKWLKKRLALLTYQGKDFRHAAAIHVTSESEASQCKEVLRLKSPIVMSPNGVNTPLSLPEKRMRSDGFKHALFLSRIHYKKGLRELVEAWERVRPRGWKMEIAGTDELGYQRQIEELVAKRGLSESFVFMGPLDDDKKWEAYRQADAFILPSHSENFGIVVAEALYAGLPVVTTTATPWSELKVRQCGWWVEDSIQGLSTALEHMTATSRDELIAMGLRGKRLIDEKYSWDSVCRPLISAYEAILGK